MKFVADLHIHSKYSRATAKNLDLEHLHMAAQVKGISVVGTGDFTHPGWYEELSNKLVPAGDGLFRLRDEIARPCNQRVPSACRSEVRFLLTSEISNIYKKNGKTRKNHNLVLVPDFERADRFTQKMEQIGNIRSDGRPILGLDARDLLEIVLDGSDANYLIPAHIWTPWFSLLGSKSGFDSIEECFEDLSEYIFAVETGLSSDPPMNWRVSFLDRMTLVSNSDAHSPMKLGREANLFDTDRSYAGIRNAIEKGKPGGFLGTIEFFPEEGKYHFDGHRKCGVTFSPEQTHAAGGQCPQCGRPLTLGVLYRVEELADRRPEEGPKQKQPFYHTVPLVDILSEIYGVGPGTKTVARSRDTLYEKLGCEIDVLRELEITELNRSGIPMLGDAIHRMRTGEIFIEPGFDGEFGTVRIFTPEERASIVGQKGLFFIPENTSVPKELDTADPPVGFDSKPEPIPPRRPHRKARAVLDGLNSEQKRGATSDRSSVLIVAGPGTGKTRTLTHRLAWLIRETGIDPTNILAVTFTNKAAEEMRRRTGELLGATEVLPLISTFHGFCHHVLTRYGGERRGIIDDAGRNDLVHEGKELVRAKGVEIKASTAAVGEWIASVKQRFLLPDAAAGACNGVEAEECLEIYRAYQELLDRYGLWDFEDLICRTVQLIETEDRVGDVCRKRFRHIVIDEYQDINSGQYKLLRLLMPQIPKGSSLCVIGDPDQSIYGFRGSDVRYFERFTEEYPGTEVIELNRSYRSTETIVQAAVQVISGRKKPVGEVRLFSGIDGHRTVEIIECATERAEAVAIGKTIERLMGGTGFHSLDFDKVDDTAPAEELGFSEFAVLARTGSQLNVFEEVFDAAGIPFQNTRKERFLDRPGIREMLSLLKIFSGAGTLHDFGRVNTRLGNGIGRKTERSFKAWAAGKRLGLRDAMANVRRFPVSGIGRQSQQRLCDLVERISDIERSIRKLSVTETLCFLADNLALKTEFQKISNSGAVFRTLLNESEAFQNETEAFLAAMALKTDTDFQVYAHQKVSLLTMHAAKGLEFPVVFVSGCEEGLIPYHHKRRPSSRDEEKRLFYVAMTRAESRLFLTWCRKRRIFGKTAPGRPSEFVGEIEARLMEHIKPQKEKKKNQVQLDLF